MADLRNYDDMVESDDSLNPKKRRSDERNGPAQGTKAMAPLVFFACPTMDKMNLTDTPYKQGSTDDFVHFCGQKCQKGSLCHNMGPPGLSKSLAQFGYCKFCLNAGRPKVIRTCTARLHVVRVGTMESCKWYGVIQDALQTPLRSSGKSKSEALADIDRQFREGKISQETAGEMKVLRGAKHTLQGGIKEINELARKASSKKEGEKEDPELGRQQGRCHDLMKFLDFSDGLDLKEGRLKSAMAAKGPR